MNAAANGLATGAALTFGMGHLLYTLPSSVQPIGAALMTAFRGMGGSFGSAIAGGVVARHLEDELSSRFKKHHSPLTEADLDLIRKLKGAPAMVWEQSGWIKDESLQAYFVSIQGVFVVALALAILAMVLQACTTLGAKRDEEAKAQEATRPDQAGSST